MKTARESFLPSFVRIGTRTITEAIGGQGSGEPIPEGDFKPLPETDPQLKCDPDGALMARSPSVIALARKKAEDMASRLAPKAPEVKRVVDDLVAPPSTEPDSLGGGRFGRTDVPGGVLEKVLFLSEIGMPVPGLLWRPSSGASRPGLVIMIHERGKQAVAQSGFPEALMKAGYALLALDLRGRGETLGQVNPNRAKTPVGPCSPVCRCSWDSS